MTRLKLVLVAHVAQVPVVVVFRVSIKLWHQH